MADGKYQPSYEISGHDSNGGHSDTKDVEVHGDRRLSHIDVAKITKTSATLTVLVAGLALFSDGYNAQIIGCVPRHSCR
jgi:hypothetical protein